MHYESKAGPQPEQSESFHAKTYLGRVQAADYPAAMDALLKTLPPPPLQKRFNIATMATEQCKPDGSFYNLEEARPPLFKCTEWTEQRAIPILIQRGIIHTDLPKQGNNSQMNPQRQPATSHIHTQQGNIQQALHPSQVPQGSTGWIYDQQHQRFKRFDGQQWIWAPSQ